MNKDFHLNLQLLKVDQERREVYGRAALETPDKSNEILDYDSSRPNFEKWSNEIREATNGLSLGNVRAMHGKVAAGKLIQMVFNDEEKAIDVVAKVVDDAEWEKVQQGVYTGFSVGGSYAKRWPDPDNSKLTRYTAQPVELSLVDNPAIPGATFSMIKADGLVEEVEFMKKADKGEYGTHREAGYADPGYQADEKPRYPLKENGKWSPERIRAAWSYIHVEKNQEPYTAAEVKEIEARIIHAWKEEIDPAGPPEAMGGAKDNGKGDNHEKSASSSGVSTMPQEKPLEKGMYDVAQFALLVQDIAALQESAEWETMMEGDKSKIPGKLKTQLKQFSALLREMVDEETKELVGDPSTPNPETPLAQSAQPSMTKTVDGLDLEKLIGGAIEKAVAPLQARIMELEALPVIPVGSLNTLNKSADTVAPAPVEAPKVRDAYGEEHATASLIKAAHLTGGRPLIGG